MVVGLPIVPPAVRRPDFLEGVGNRFGLLGQEAGELEKPEGVEEVQLLRGEVHPTNPPSDH